MYTPRVQASEDQQHCSTVSNQVNDKAHRSKNEKHSPRLPAGLALLTLQFRLNPTADLIATTQSQSNQQTEHREQYWTMMAASSGSAPIVAASPSQARIVQRAPPDRTEEEESESKNNEDLLRIHRQALQLLRQRTTLDARTNTLQSLQRKRIRLACELEQAKQVAASGRTVGNELRERKRRRCALDRPYFWRNNKSVVVNDDSVQEVLEEQDMAVRMREIRQARKIAAAYRLAGISMLPCPDSDVLALRFDIEMEGAFVACYHCFFDLVVMEEDGEDKKDMLHIRLIQHTLPSAIPLGTIIDKTMGGVACIGPYDDDSQWATGDLQKRLRQCANEIYEACYCYSGRKQTAVLLKSLASKEESSSFFIEGLRCSDRLDKISFHLKLVSGISSLSVTLCYKDPMRAQPTHVVVQNLAASSPSMRVQNRLYAAEVSDDDDDSDSHVKDDLTENAIVSFRRLPIRQALQEVAEAMAEW